MKKAKAVELFHGKDKYNCTQAVLKTFQEESGVSEQAIKAAAKAGGGKAKDGLCGALHATRILLDEEHFQTLSSHFADKAGAPQCKIIRSQKRLTCKGCVSLAADLMTEHVEALCPEDPNFRTALSQREQTMLPKPSWLKRVFSPKG